MRTPLPPATSAWFSLETALANVLARLRLTERDVDTAELTECIVAGAALIDQHLDRTEPLPIPTPQPILGALERVAVVLYQRGAGAPTSGVVASSWAPGIGGFDPLDDVRAELGPYRQRWGIG